MREMLRKRRRRVATSIVERGPPFCLPLMRAGGESLETVADGGEDAEAMPPRDI